MLYFFVSLKKVKEIQLLSGLRVVSKKEAQNVKFEKAKKMPYGKIHKSLKYLSTGIPPHITEKRPFSETRRGSPVDRRPSTAEAPPIAKIHPFSKMAVTFEPLKGF